MFCFSFVFGVRRVISGIEIERERERVWKRTGTQLVQRVTWLLGFHLTEFRSLVNTGPVQVCYLPAHY
jgi:hypothetical protein